MHSRSFCFPVRSPFAILALGIFLALSGQAFGSSDNLTPTSMHPCWEYEAVPWAPAAQYTEKFNTCFVLVGKAAVDLRASPVEAWGKLTAHESCPFQSLALSNSLGFEMKYTYRWKCPGQGEVEGVAQFFRSGLVNFIQNDAGYSIDNYIHLKTPLLEHVWSLQQGGSATSGSMGTPPPGSVGGSASLSYQGAQVQVSMGSQPRALSYSFKLDKTSPTFDEGPACLTEYSRQIISRSELSGWVDGSPFSPAQLAVDIHSSLVSSFSLLPCPENEE